MCGHESVFTLKGIVSRPQTSPISVKHEKWGFIPRKVVADSSYMAAPYLSHEILKNTTIIKLTRNPLDVVSSFVFAFGYFKHKEPKNKWEKFIFSHKPEVWGESSPVERGLRYYIEWNKMIDPYSHITHKIEDNIELLLKKLDISPSETMFCDKKCNTRKKKLFKWETVNSELKSELKEYLRGQYENIIPEILL